MEPKRYLSLIITKMYVDHDLSANQLIYNLAGTFTDDVTGITLTVNNIKRFDVYTSPSIDDVAAMLCKEMADTLQCDVCSVSPDFQLINHVDKASSDWTTITLPGTLTSTIASPLITARGVTYATPYIKNNNAYSSILRQADKDEEAGIDAIYKTSLTDYDSGTTMPSTKL